MICRQQITAIILLLSVFIIANAHAEPVVEIDKIVITESVAVPDSVPMTTQPTNVQNIKSTAPKTESAADVVQKTSGVHIKHYGGLEESTSISIRGSSHSQVNVFLDGVPLDTASADGVGLGQIASSSLSKIEVYKNLTPTEFGTSAIGGVVNLKSKQIDPGFTHHYGFGFGSFTSLNGVANLSYGGAKNDISFGLIYRFTKGDFTFLDNNGTPLNTADDQRVKRQNNEQQVIHPQIKWVHRFNDETAIQVSSHFFRIDSGVPGLASFQSSLADRSLTESLTSISLKHKGFFNGKGSLNNQVFGRFIKSQFTDLAAEIGIGQAQDTDDLTLILGDRFILQTDVSEDFIVKKGVEYIYEYFLPKDYVAVSQTGSTSQRHQANLFLEPHFYLFHKKVLLSFKGQVLNVFYDINNNDPSLNNAGTFSSNRIENQWAGTLALNYSPFDNLHLKTSFGRAVRLPKFVEMFGDQGYVLGNAQLTSEKSLKFDVGFLFHKKYQSWFNRFQFEANYFETHTDDLIQFEMASGYARASNIGEALIRGFEVSASAKVFQYVSLNANYTYQWAKDEAQNVGNYLVGRPKHDFNWGIGFDKAGFSTALNLNFIDDQYLDALNTGRIDNRLILGFEAGCLFKEHYRVGFEARNITNSQVVDAVGFPLPGRSFFGRLDVYF